MRCIAVALAGKAARAAPNLDCLKDSRGSDGDLIGLSVKAQPDGKFAAYYSFAPGGNGGSLTMYPKTPITQVRKVMAQQISWWASVSSDFKLQICFQFSFVFG